MGSKVKTKGSTIIRCFEMKNVSIIHGKLVQCRTVNVREVTLHVQQVGDFLDVWQIPGAIEDILKAPHQDPLARRQDQPCRILLATRSRRARNKRNLGSGREHQSGKKEFKKLKAHHCRRVNFYRDAIFDGPWPIVFCYGNSWAYNATRKHEA